MKSWSALLLLGDLLAPLDVLVDRPGRIVGDGGARFRRREVTARRNHQRRALAILDRGPLVPQADPAHDPAHDLAVEGEVLLLLILGTQAGAGARHQDDGAQPRAQDRPGQAAASRTGSRHAGLAHGAHPVWRRPRLQIIPLG
jgi:hypothetical protein